MKLPPRTLAMIGTGAVILIALLYFTFRTEPVPVDLQQVIRGPLRVTVNADGKTRIREIYDVAAPISGMTRRSPVDVGDQVIAGETVVAIVEPAEPGLLDRRTRLQAEAAVQEAEAALSVAKSRVNQSIEDLSYAKAQFERTQTLVNRGIATMTKLEEDSQRLAIAQSAYNAALSNSAMAEGALERAKATLLEPGQGDAEVLEQCCVNLFAPITGTVLAVEKISETPVTAGALLVSIGQPDDLEIIADLLSSDAVRLKIGASASVERWGGPVPLEARLRSIEPSARTKISALGIEEQRVDAVFDLLTPPAKRKALGDGFAVFLRIVEWQEDDVLQVPLNALFRRGDEWAVFTVDEDNIAHRVMVEVGVKNGNAAQILSGLDVGQTLITHPSELIAEGVTIIDREDL